LFSIYNQLDCFEATSEWLALQNINIFEWWSKEYIDRVFPQFEWTEARIFSPDPVTIVRIKEILPHQESVCVKMWSELDHLIVHYGVVGGDKEVIGAAKLVQSCLLGLAEVLQRVVTANSRNRLLRMNQLSSTLGRLYLATGKFKGSLYHQKHAFYFREVKNGWIVY